MRQRYQIATRKSKVFSQQIYQVVVILIACQIPKTLEFKDNDLLGVLFQKITHLFKLELIARVIRIISFSAQVTIRSPGAMIRIICRILQFYAQIKIPYA